MLDRDELNARIAELEPQLSELAEEIDCSVDSEVNAVTNELEALYFLRDIYYLEDEGFLTIEGERVYARSEWCLT